MKPKGNHSAGLIRLGHGKQPSVDLPRDLSEYSAAILQWLGGHFTTAQLSQATASSITATRQALSRLEVLGTVTKVARGKWVDMTRIGRLALPEFLTGSSTYITAHTAMYHHWMIEQVPVGIYGVSTGRRKTFVTPFGTVYIHQISPALFRGWRTESRSQGAKIATPEKALTDYFYLELTGHPFFGKLPELEVSADFRWKKAHQFADLIVNRSWRTFVHARLDRQEAECILLASVDSAEAST